MVALKGQMHCNIRKHQQMEQVHKTERKLKKTLLKNNFLWGFVLFFFYCTWCVFGVLFYLQLFDLSGPYSVLKSLNLEADLTQRMDISQETGSSVFQALTNIGQYGYIHILEVISLFSSNTAWS